MPPLLTRLQGGLEHLYRIATGVDVRDFVIDPDARAAALDDGARTPREQLLLYEVGGELSVALFVDPGVVANLERNDPAEALGDHNASDFLLAVEGVSHFIYVVWCAQAERQVSALELELQAEVDKYVACLLLATADRAASARWRRRLYEDFSFEPDLDAGERDRYHAANHNARRFAASLEHRFVARRRIVDMLVELRRFYRLSLAAKLDHIARAA
jgi:hypothetical protein